jgi:RPA family protein
MMDTAKRVFAREFNASSLLYKAGDDKYAPKQLVTLTGARCTRVFAIGVLTEKYRVPGNGGGQWRAKVSDPTGVYDIYAWEQFETQASAFLADAPTPSYVAVLGRPRLFEMTRVGRGVSMALNPELMVSSDGMARDIWTQETIRLTLSRIDDLKAGVSDDARLALASYGKPDYSGLRAMLLTANATLPEGSKGGGL